MAQILPADDLFNQDGPSSQTPSIWIRHRPYAGLPTSYGAGGTEFDPFPSLAARITDAFATYPANCGDPIHATFARLLDFGSYSATGGAMFRNAIVENGEVEMMVRSLFNTDDIDVSTFRGHVLSAGIGLRMQLGVNESGQASLDGVRDTRGYLFMRNAENSIFRVGWKYQLFRLEKLVGGNTKLVRLAEDPVGFENFFPYSAIAGGPPTKMRLTCETNGGGDVDLNCYVAMNGQPESLVLSHTDSSLDKVTGAGRMSFMCSSEESNDSSGEDRYSARVFSYVSGRDLDTGDIVFRDEWVRHNLSLAENFQHDEFARFGRVLNQGYAGDAYTTRDLIGGLSLTYKLKLDLGLDDCLAIAGNVPALPGDSVQAFISQIRAVSPTSQHRSVEFTFIHQTALPDLLRFAGIILREGGTNPEASVFLGSAYAVLVGRDDDTGIWSAEVRRYNGGTALLLANMALALAEDIAFTLDVKVTNTGAGPGQLENEVRIEAKLDGAPLVFLELTSPPAGIVVDAAGVIFDSSSGRLSNGYGEGFMISGADNSHDFRFDTWLDLLSAPAPPPLDCDGSDRVSIFFPVECSGKFGTLTLPLTFPVREMEPHEIREAPFESDHRWASVDEHAERRAWEVAGRPVERVDGDTLLAFYDSHGVEFPFDWVEPDGATVCVGFIDARMAVGLLRPEVAEYAFILEERRT